MNINFKLKEMVDSQTWPGINAITYGDGKMTLLDIEFYEDHNYYLGPIADTSIESYLKYNRDQLSSFDITAKAEHESYDVLVGDGSDESNGIVFVVNRSNQHLVWFAFFECSDPFKSVYVDEKCVNAITSSGVRWRISITDPLNIQLIWPAC